jgi:hypothetical protein
MQFYVVDTTVNPSQDKRFNNYSDLVTYLGGMSERAFNQTKKQRTFLLEEMGYGTDDYNSTLFVRSLQERFSIGIIREGRKMQCDVTTFVAFQKPEYGD